MAQVEEAHCRAEGHRRTQERRSLTGTPRHTVGVVLHMAPVEVLRMPAAGYMGPGDHHMAGAHRMEEEYRVERWVLHPRKMELGNCERLLQLASLSAISHYVQGTRVCVCLCQAGVDAEAIALSGKRVHLFLFVSELCCPFDQVLLLVAVIIVATLLPNVLL